MFDSLVKFINYWYFRYLLVTELYMVEKWERIMIHIVFLIIFSIISFINSTIIVGLVSFLSNMFSGESLGANEMSQLSEKMINSEL